MNEADIVFSGTVGERNDLSPLETVSGDDVAVGTCGLLSATSDQGPLQNLSIGCISRSYLPFKRVSIFGNATGVW